VHSVGSLTVGLVQRTSEARPAPLTTTWTEAVVKVIIIIMAEIYNVNQLLPTSIGGFRNCEEPQAYSFLSRSIKYSAT